MNDRAGRCNIHLKLGFIVCWVHLKNFDSNPQERKYMH